MKEGKEVGGVSIVSGGDGAQLLELADGALDEVAPFVDFRIEGAPTLRAAAPRDDRAGAHGVDGVEDGVAVVGLVGADVGHVGRGEAVDEGQGLAGIVDLATGEKEVQRPALPMNGTRKTESRLEGLHKHSLSTVSTQRGLRYR